MLKIYHVIGYSYLQQRALFHVQRMIHLQIIPLDKTERLIVLITSIINDLYRSGGHPFVTHHFPLSCQPLYLLLSLSVAQLQ